MDTPTFKAVATIDRLLNIAANTKTLTAPEPGNTLAMAATEREEDLGQLGESATTMALDLARSHNLIEDEEADQHS